MRSGSESCWRTAGATVTLFFQQKWAESDLSFIKGLKGQVAPVSDGTH
jgi:hypothetical protein